MQPTDHLDDEVLSALVDDQLTLTEAATARSHLGMCEVCQASIEDFRSVALLLRGLPEVAPPRDFAIGPREVADPPNVIRLRRWYTAMRVAAASLAAVFVALSAGTLYIDSRPAPNRTAEVAPPQLASAPAASNGAAGIAPQAAASPAAAAPAAPRVAPVAARSAPSTPQADDQVAAATSSRPLPTPLPTATVALPPPAARIAQATADALDPTAPLRTAAVLVGVLAVLTLLATLVIRHRLRFRTSHL